MAENENEAVEKMKETIASGAAKQKLAEFVEAQNGDASYVWNTELFPKAAYTIEVLAKDTGYIQKIHAESIGNACMVLGGGRETKDSEIDLSVGIMLNKKCSDFVAENESIATVYANDKTKGEEAVRRIQNAYTIGKNAVEKSAMIKAVIEE